MPATTRSVSAAPEDVQTTSGHHSGEEISNPTMARRDPGLATPEKEGHVNVPTEEEDIEMEDTPVSKNGSGGGFPREGIAPAPIVPKATDELLKLTKGMFTGVRSIESFWDVMAEGGVECVLRTMNTGRLLASFNQFDKVYKVPKIQGLLAVRNKGTGAISHFRNVDDDETEVPVQMYAVGKTAMKAERPYVVRIAEQGPFYLMDSYDPITFSVGDTEQVGWVGAGRLTKTEKGTFPLSDTLKRAIGGFLKETILPHFMGEDNHHKGVMKVVKAMDEFALTRDTVKGEDKVEEFFKGVGDVELAIAASSLLAVDIPSNNTKARVMIREIQTFLLTILNEDEGIRFLSATCNTGRSLATALLRFPGVAAPIFGDTPDNIVDSVDHKRVQPKMLFEFDEGEAVLINTSTPSISQLTDALLCKKKIFAVRKDVIYGTMGGQDQTASTRGSSSLARGRGAKRARGGNSSRATFKPLKCQTMDASLLTKLSKLYQDLTVDPVLTPVAKAPGSDADVDEPKPKEVIPIDWDLL